MRVVVVTGAAGFIGSNLSRRLLADGFSVVGIDSFDDFYDHRLKQANVADLIDHPLFVLHRIDIRDTEAMMSVCTGPIDTVVHLAALVGVRPSADWPDDYRSVNVDGTRSVLDVAAARSIPHMVFASSSSIYGVNPAVPWVETAEPRPISVYAETKLTGEALVRRAAAEREGFSAVTARLFTVYGPGQRPDLAITNFAVRMLSGQPIVIFGDGSARRDFTHVDDIVDGLRRAIDHRGSAATVNLAAGRRVGLAEVITTLQSVLGVTAAMEHVDPVGGDVPQTWGSINEAERLLGYRPTVDLATGIKASRPWFETVAALAAGTG